MHLRSYFDAERGRIARLAEAEQVSASLVTQWARGKSVPAERGPSIEKFTGYEVMRWDLRPDDWHRIWPELIGSEGAPPIEPEIGPTGTAPDQTEKAAA